jgi:predicted regulator of Ras-like GTPase activity (Roadblock/LC7/MglB family)
VQPTAPPRRTGPPAQLVASTTLSPSDAPDRLFRMSSEVRAALLLDERGELVAASGEDSGSAESLAELAKELCEAAAGAARGAEVEEVEAQVARGAVYASRARGMTLVAITRRGALSSLMRYDMWMVLGEIEDDAR